MPMRWPSFWVQIMYSSPLGVVAEHPARSLVVREPGLGHLIDRVRLRVLEQVVPADLAVGALRSAVVKVLLELAGVQRRDLGHVRRVQGLQARVGLEDDSGDADDRGGARHPGRAVLLAGRGRQLGLSRRRSGSSRRAPPSARSPWASSASAWRTSTTWPWPRVRTRSAQPGPRAQPCRHQDEGRQDREPARPPVPARPARPVRRRLSAGGLTRLARARGAELPAVRGERAAGLSRPGRPPGGDAPGGHRVQRGRPDALGRCRVTGWPGCSRKTCPPAPRPGCQAAHCPAARAVMVPKARDDSVPGPKMPRAIRAASTNSRQLP